MMKTSRFLLAAGISLALAFTFSCSSDDGDESGGGSFNENSQIVNPDGTPYSGNGVIKIGFEECGDILSAGTVIGGVVSLASPLPPPSGGCLEDFDFPITDCNISPSDTQKADASFELWDEDGESFINNLVIEYRASGIKEEVEYSYISNAATIACNGNMTPTITVSINGNVVAGWNKLYSQTTGSQSSATMKAGTDKNILTKELKWTLD